MTLVVTGASGFIGRRLCADFVRRGREVVPVSRTVGQSVGNIDGNTDWSTVLKPGVTVIHLAARAHVLDRSKAADLAAFREVNVEGTRRLASEAARIGVDRLVFLSSVGVLGTHTNNRPPFSVGDEPAPTEAYAQSKYEAELALREVAARTGLRICILRPPLVYGPGAPGNAGRLLDLVRRGIALPLGAIRNARSLVALDNLVDLIRVCAMHPSAVGETFLASDGHAVSTPELIRGVASAMGKRARLIRVPVGLLELTGRMLGKSADVARLVDSLEVDIGHTCNTLGWHPVIGLEEGLRRMVRS